MKLDLKHMREFAFSMTAKKSGESIIALIDEIETLYTLAQEMADALEMSWSKVWLDGTKAKKLSEQALTKWTEFKK